MSHGKENPNWKGGPVQKICAHCGIEFTVVRAREKTAKYCGRSCSGKVASAIGHAIKATIATYHRKAREAPDFRPGRDRAARAACHVVAFRILTPIM